jgi:hypothetical protein
MKRKGIAFIIIVGLTMSFSNCEGIATLFHGEKPEEKEDVSPFEGTWHGTFDSGFGPGAPMTLVFSGNTWAWTLNDGGGWGFNGTFTYSGNHAELDCVGGPGGGTADLSGNTLYHRMPNYYGPSWVGTMSR